MNLHRTLNHDCSNPWPIRDLILGPMDLPSPSPWPVRLLARCTSLKVLEISFPELDYSDGGFPTNFKHLHELRLSCANLRLVAPLIAKCPNLSILRIHNFKNDLARPPVFFTGGPPPGDSLSDIPAPAYNLRELSLKDGRLGSS
ncbi:hypothetical protein C8R44DRAFT_866183 [Mycena epipterygia]|nr:hypothetical protein C8R44DRAFT_866183 [Mycena epipterygia]